MRDGRETGDGEDRGWKELKGQEQRKKLGRVWWHPPAIPELGEKAEGT